MREWLRKRLTWATVDQACGEPLNWHQRFFRWLGWPVLIIALLVPSVASAQILPPYVPPAPYGTQYAVPWRAIRPLARWGVRSNYGRPPQAQGRWLWQPGQYQFVPGEYKFQPSPQQRTPQQK